MNNRSYWINTISQDHVLAGVEGGFTQAGHGKSTKLENLKQGDFLVFYSAKTQLENGEPLQSFTAIGKITDSEPYQVKVPSTFRPWRRNMSFFPSKEAPIRPLIDALSFIQNKQRWGFPFMRGLFEIERQDFEKIASAMAAKTSVEYCSHFDCSCSIAT